MWLLCLVRAFYGLCSLSGQLGAMEWRGWGEVEVHVPSPFPITVPIL